jgi:hypothetical protein
VSAYSEGPRTPRLVPRGRIRKWADSRDRESRAEGGGRFSPFFVLLGLHVLVGIVLASSLVYARHQISLAINLGGMNFRFGRNDYFVSQDVLRYWQLAHHSGTPYRDFTSEYPPLLLVVTRLLGSSVGDVARRLVVLASLFDVGLAWALSRRFGRRAGTLYLGLTLVLLPEFLERFDLIVVALVILSFLAAERQSRRVTSLGGVLLTAAVMLKIWPLILVPWFIIRRQWAALCACLASLLIAFVAWFAIGGLGAFGQVVGFRGARGWQVESSLGAFVELLTRHPALAENGAFRTRPMPMALGALATIATCAAIIWVWSMCWQGRRCLAAPTIWLGATATVSFVLVGSLLFSPQYLIWILPFVAIVGTMPGGQRPLRWLVLAGMVQWIVQSLFKIKDSWHVWAAVLYETRNALVLAVGVTAAIALRASLQPSAPALAPAMGTSPHATSNSSRVQR